MGQALGPAPAGGRTVAHLNRGAILAFFGLLILLLGDPGPIYGNPTKAEIEKNIREGFAATSGFEIVTVDRVPLARKGRSLSDPAYQDAVTYRLDPHPDAYKVRSQGLHHLQWVTLGWRVNRRASPFVFDLYLHGEPQFKNSLAIRVAQLDIRKFLHQSIASFSDNANLTRLQAYFEEFSRKSKIIYPLPPESQDKTATSASYEGRLLAEIEEELDDTIKTLDSAAPERESLMRAQQSARQSSDHLKRKEFGGLGQRYQELWSATNAGKTQWEGGANLAQKALMLTLTQKVTDVKITNNCREPGNYEVEVRDAQGRYLLRANFIFSTQDYEAFLTHYHGLGIADQGTGIGVPSTIRNRERLRYWDSYLPWKWMKSFPRVNVEALSVIQGSGGEPLLDPPLTGEIEVARGRIPFEDYEYDAEVMGKSGYHWPGLEPLSYVRVNRNLPPPAGFTSPDGSPPDSYWTSRAHADKVVPYYFRTFEDIQRYDVYLSGFDLNGVYIGRSDLVAFDKERENGRWHFNFQYLQKLNRFEFQQGRDGLVEIRMTSESSGKDAVNFVFGNFSVPEGKSIEFLLGLGTQPLIEAYNHNPYKTPLVYGMAYGANGNILDHHERGIGVEKVYIERTGTETYKIRLISYERILPVWEGVIEASK